MKELFRKQHRLIFFSSWLLLGLIQSSFTRLEDDEAYYWVYSKFLAWGYFDHPPMIALLVKGGYAFFPNEMGVRLLPLLLNTLSLLIIEKLLRPKNPFLFYTIILSIGVLQVGGFMAVPDTPLIFFTAAFFWCYKKFTDRFSLTNAALLGIVSALLMYSKYHGVLILFFTLLSNPKLLRRYPVYIVGLTMLLCYMPHLWWQYQHGWPSVQYHLFERNAVAYKFSFTLKYIVSQVLITGPVAGVLLLPACLLYKPRNEIEKAFRYCFTGIFVFFLLSTLKGRVEANWTAPVAIPLIALSYLFINERPKWKSALLKTLPFTLLLVLLFRISMIVDWLPFHFFKARYHSWEKWPQQMNKITGGLPVVFSNSHQQAAKYWFYSGQMAYSQQLYKSRRSNYNFWPIEDSLLGKPVYFLSPNDLWRFPDSLKITLGFMGFRYDSSFASFAKVNFTVIPGNIIENQGKELTIHCTVHIPEHYERFIRSHALLTDTTRIGVFNKTGWQKDIFTSLSLNQMVDQKEFTLIINPGLSKGTYYLLFSINNSYYNGTHNSDKIKLMVE
jgi:Dolichyl-phosphate-mannose-protein mannosyltransferase